jgi:hypothetical protein
MVMVFNATFNNISVISLRSVLLVVETGEKFEYIELQEILFYNYKINGFFSSNPPVCDWSVVFCGFLHQ